MSFLNKLVIRILREVARFKIFRCVFLGFVNFLARFVKRDHRLVLCGAMNGYWYGDNSRYVYEWVLRNRPELKPIWLTNDQGVWNKLTQERKPVCKIASFAGMMHLLKGEIGIFTNSLYDLALHPFLTPNHLKLIALRHGRSVKRIRFARKGHQISSDEAIERHRESSLIVWAISTSEFISDLQEECLQIGRDKHVVTGYPRNDYLWESTIEAKHDWLSFNVASSGSKVILYAPSWRHGRGPTRFFPFDDFDAKSLIEYLEKRGVILILRPHANDLRIYPEQKAFLNSLAQESKNIRLATHEVFPDVNSILPFVDALITDYSALYHDYILLDRPILFIPYDYHDFTEKNGFLYDYMRFLPGPLVGNQKSLESEIDRVVYGDDRYIEKRNTLRLMLHKYIDNRSCERVVELIVKLIPSRELK